MSFMHLPAKKNNNQYPNMFSFQSPLSNTLINLEFVYLKLDFTYSILLQSFIVSKFFLIIKTTRHSSFKTLEPILLQQKKYVKFMSCFYPITIIYCWGHYRICPIFTLTISRSVGVKARHLFLTNVHVFSLLLKEFTCVFVSCILSF